LWAVGKQPQNQLGTGAYGISQVGDLRHCFGRWRIGGAREHLSVGETGQTSFKPAKGILELVAEALVGGVDRFGLREERSGLIAVA
jgi:hypothetical protein